jgi:hypothetical protein
MPNDGELVDFYFVEAFSLAYCRLREQNQLMKNYGDLNEHSASS